MTTSFGQIISDQAYMGAEATALVGAVVADRVGGGYDTWARSSDCGPVQLNRGIKIANANKNRDHFKNCKLKFSS